MFCAVGFGLVLPRVWVLSSGFGLGAVKFELRFGFGVESSGLGALGVVNFRFWIRFVVRGLVLELA